MLKTARYVGMRVLGARKREEWMKGKQRPKMRSPAFRPAVYPDVVLNLTRLLFPAKATLT